MALLSHETLPRQKMAQQSPEKYVAQDYFCDACAEKMAQLVGMEYSTADVLALVQDAQDLYGLC